MILCDGGTPLSKSGLRAWAGGRSPVGPRALVTTPTLFSVDLRRANGVVAPSSGVVLGFREPGRYRGPLGSVVQPTKRCEKAPFSGFLLPIEVA